MVELTEAQRIQRDMKEILRRQADPKRPSPLAERWAYLDRRDAAGRAALEQEGRR